jgi:hypothetical protein
MQLPESWELLDRGTDFCVIARKRATGSTVWRLAFKPGVRGGKTDWRVTGILFPNTAWKSYSGTLLSDSVIDRQLRSYAERGITWI